MKDMIEKALSSKRESKSVEFKQGFDCDSKGEWCEVIKDVVAIANSGGGVIVFGLGNTGEPVESDISKIAALDPADLLNKTGSYTNGVGFDISISDSSKDGKNVVVFLIGPSTMPLVFEKPGNYQDPQGKQKSAFAIGTAYFRHGAKSESATNDDIRKSFARQVDLLRTEWLDGVRKVVEAPSGSQVLIAAPSTHPNQTATSMRLANEPGAVPVRLTRALEGTAGTLLHEEISEALFDEINNVIDTNRLLFPGQNRFLLGPRIYNRIYAERQHVVQSEQEIAQFLYAGIGEYCPFFFWCSLLTDKIIAEYLADIVLRPRGNQIQTLLRMIPLLGGDFCEWLQIKYSKKWGSYSQPPAFYWRLMDLTPNLGMTDAMTCPRFLIH